MRTKPLYRILATVATAVLCTLLILSFVSPLPVGYRFLSMGTSYPVSASPDWLSGWNKRIQLTTNSSLIDSDLSHFPITVFLNSDNGEIAKVFDEVGDNKYKIAITDDSAPPVEYYVEIEKWVGSDLLPFLDENLSRDSNNPIITYATPGLPGGTVYVADPCVIEINDELYIFFEAKVYRGKIVMGKLSYGTWGDFQTVSVIDQHFQHPHVYIVGSTVHLFYDTNGMTDGGKTGTEGTFHRSSPLSGFPDWTSETQIFDSENYGWGKRCINTQFINSDSKWFLLGICNATGGDDRTIYARYADDITANWSNSEEYTDHPDNPLVDVTEGGSWVDNIVELSHVYVDEDLYFLMGATDNVTSERAIAAYNVTTLTTTNFSGGWYDTEHVFPLAESGWDSEDIHRGSVALHEGKWYFAYDARYLSGTNWKIGFAYMEVIGAILHFGKSGETLPSASDKDYYLYYDNDHADNTDMVGDIDSTPGHNVWDADFELVYHMVDGVASNVTDSTSQSNNGSKCAVNEPYEVGGKIGKAQGFDGSNDYISVGDDDSLDFGASDSFSVGVWFETDYSGSTVRLLDKTVETNQEGYRFTIRSDNHYIESSIEQEDDTNTEITTGTAVNDGDWHHFVFVRNVSDDKLYAYLDGESDATPVTDVTNDTLANNVDLWIGKTHSGIPAYFEGRIDEIRISSTARSAAWVKATYNSLNDSLLTYGNEETLTVEVTNTPSSNDFGILEVNSTGNTVIDYFTITNTGNCAVDVIIQGTDATGGDDTWTLSDTATPGENIYGLKAGLDDDDDTFDVVVRKTETYNTLVSDLVEDATQDWGLQIYMPTSLSGYDGQEMTGTVTLVASVAS